MFGKIGGKLIIGVLVLLVEFVLYILILGLEGLGGGLVFVGIGWVGLVGKLLVF